MKTNDKKQKKGGDKNEEVVLHDIVLLFIVS